MIEKTVVDEIKMMLPSDIIYENEPMKRHTTFCVGGEARVYVRITEILQLQRLIPYLTKNNIPYFIIGNGSNLLVSDDGFHGVMIEIGNSFSGVIVEGNRLKAKAGTLLSKVSNFAMKESLSGIEFASGIPGTIGGAVVMNAGAYDGEMKQVVKEVTVLCADGEIKTFSNDEMQFGYRFSIIKNNPYVVLEVVLELQRKDEKEIKKKMDDFLNRRREKQPLEFPSAGSTFKRPNGYYAGKLIMDSELRGFQIGGAEVSEKHCGFIINKNNATEKFVYLLV